MSLSRARSRFRFFVIWGSITTGACLLPENCLGQWQASESAPERAVMPAVKHDVSLPLWQLAAMSSHGGDASDASKEADVEEDGRQARPMTPLSAEPAVDPMAQIEASGALVAVPGLNFDGVPGTNYKAPDTNGAVGATQYVQWVNLRYSVYNKTSGAKVLGPTDGSNFWAGFGGDCQTQNQGDVIAQYDKAAGRWVMTHRAGPTSGPYLECVAVSVTSDATGSYYRYAFVNPFNDFFTDYPKLASWPDGYYFSTDLQDASNHFKFQQSMVCAFQRSQMLLGKAASEQCFLVPKTTIYSLLPSDVDGSTAPPAGSPSYFINLDNANNSLDFWRFHVNWTTPSDSTFTGPTLINLPLFTEACHGGQCIPQPNTTEVVDSLGDRVMYRLSYRNFGSYESLLVTHSVNVGASVGIRWYEIRHPEGNPPVGHQAGTYAPDSNFRWMPSIAQDKVGDIAVGYSVSSSSMYPSIRYTGRVPTDPLGTMESEATVINGSGSELPPDWRWGDYTAMTIDPSDDCTFWYTNEYYSVSSVQSWRTRITSFKFPGCN